MSQSLLHARENLEWMCRSAWNMAGAATPWRGGPGLILPGRGRHSWTASAPDNGREPGAWTFQAPGVGNAMNLGMLGPSWSDGFRFGSGGRPDRTAAPDAGPLDQHRRTRRDQRGHDRDQGDLPARHSSHDHGVDHGDRTGVRSGACPPPPPGIIAVDAEAPLAKPAATTARLASTTPSLLKLLMVRMNSSPSPGRGRGRPPGPLRSLQCDGMAAPPRSGSGALPSFCVPVPRFSAGQPDGAAGHATPLRWDSCPPTGQSGPCDRSGQNSPRGRLSGVRAGSRTRRQGRAAGVGRRDRGDLRSREGRKPGSWRGTASRGPRSAAARARPSGCPRGTRLHRNGDDDQLTGVETKLRFSNHVPASAPRMARLRPGG